jgi:alpha-mannosidase
MREHPTFRFAAGSAAYYEWIERTDPGMFEEIRQRVAQGRWELVGGWWVEPDCNVPAGESLVRQALYGQRYFHSRFGRTASVGYNVDSFGHPATLPQILFKARLPRYVFMRPQPHEQRLPARLFWWEGLDGSRVLAFRVPFEYGSSGDDLTPHVRRCLEEFKDGHEDLMCFYGVGNHGGGPTRHNLEVIDRLMHTETGVDIRFSSPGDFFDAVEQGEAPIPVHAHELQHHARGCYAAHSAIKRWNRQAEHLLIAAEKLSLLASDLVGLPYPTELSRAWQDCCFNQFHDVLAGTSIEPVYDDARDAVGAAHSIGARALHRAAQALAFRIDTSAVEPGLPVVVINPHAWATHPIIEVESDAIGEASAVVDERGQRRPLQPIAPVAQVGPHRRRVAFAADLPPLGYRVYRLAPGPSAFNAPSGPTASIENECLRLEIDPLTGLCSSLIDKRHGCKAIPGPAARAVIIDDPGDTWAHGLSRLPEPVAEFRAVRVRLLERGPVRQTIRVESEYGRSRLRQDFSVSSQSALVHVRVRVDWQERRRALKILWPVNVAMPTATYEAAYGNAERPANGDEEPMHGWVDCSGIHRLTGMPYGLSLLNDGKYSASVSGSTIGLTVLRSPAYAHHDPFEPREWDDLPFTDQGVQEFTYAMLPHSGDWRAAGTVRAALELNQPPIAFLHTWHPGTFPAAASFAEVEPAGIVLSVLKAPEDGGDDLILRAVETTGTECDALIHLRFRKRMIRTHFGPYEIKTLRVPMQPLKAVTEVDLLEWPS